MAKKTISADHQRGPTRDRPRRNVLASNLVEDWSGPIFIGISFLALILWSWRKWPDPLIDFGRELYVPWRLAEGDILYRNITTPYGPLSPYLNAAFFKLFGTSFTTLIICNLAILAGLTILIYRLFKQLCDRATAVAMCIALLTVFAFSQYLALGNNFNFITPYSHESTHGVVLTVSMIYLLHSFARTGRAWLAGLAGLCLGLICLTKPEIALAAFMALLLWLALWIWHPCREDYHKTLSGSFFCFAMLLPTLAFFLYSEGTWQPPRPIVLFLAVGFHCFAQG